MQTARGGLHRLDAVNFPRLAFSDEAVKKRANRAVRVAKEDLHERGRAAHFHKAKFDALDAGDLGIVMPDHGLVLRRGEFLLHATGSLAIRARVIGGAKGREMLLDDGKQLMGRRRRLLQTDPMTHHDGRSAERHEEKQERGFDGSRHREVNLTRAVKLVSCSALAHA